MWSNTSANNEMAKGGEYDRHSHSRRSKKCRKQPFQYTFKWKKEILGRTFSDPKQSTVENKQRQEKTAEALTEKTGFSETPNHDSMVFCG